VRLVPFQNRRDDHHVVLHRQLKKKKHIYKVRKRNKATKEVLKSNRKHSLQNL
jgi:hypothetical protein